MLRPALHLVVAAIGGVTFSVIKVVEPKNKNKVS
jgi:hypothetical protein